MKLNMDVQKPLGAPDLNLDGYCPDDSPDEPVNWADYMKHHPFCPPSWRWQRILDLARAGKRGPLIRDDAPTLQTIKYLRVKHARENGHAEPLPEWMLPIGQAIELRRQGGNVCAILQAALLARESLEQAAHRVGVAPEVVRWYCQLFFDVQGRLEAHDWIVMHALGVKPFAGIPSGNRATLLGLLSYFGGPLILDTAAPVVLGLPEAAQLAPALVASVNRLVQLLGQPVSPSHLDEMVDLLVGQHAPVATQHAQVHDDQQSTTVAPPAQAAAVTDANADQLVAPPPQPIQPVEQQPPVMPPIDVLLDDAAQRPDV